MKKIKFISACFALIMIFLIVTTAIVFDKKEGKNHELELVRQEVSAQIERNMEKALKNGDFSDYLELSEVSFAVKDVCKEDVLRYVVKIVFMAKTDRELDDIEMKAAAKDMESLFQEFRTVRGKCVTVGSQKGNGGVVSVINGKVVEQGRGSGKNGSVKEQRRLVIRRKGCERVIIL